MNLYVDSSVIIAQVVDEKHEVAVDLAAVSAAFTSELTDVESRRTIDRIRLMGGYSDSQAANAVTRLDRLFESISLVRLDPFTLRIAAQPFPTIIRALDALHLAAAIVVRETVGTDLRFVTYDRQQATAARALGFQVLGAEPPYEPT